MKRLGCHGSRWGLEHFSKGIARAILVAVAILVFASGADAQSTGAIAGVVKDAQGGVLPGVTVTATSPALIERIRAVVTDGQGQFTIQLLPSGTYDVKFELPGFTTVIRQGIEVAEAFTATASADLAVGALSETVTVSGESPIVDVRRATQQSALTAEHFETIPSGKTYANMAALIPAVNFSPGRQDVGGSESRPEFDTLSVHGSRTGDTTLMMNGMKIGNMASPGDRSTIIQSPLLFEQVNVQISGGLGEAASAGPQINSIIRTGSNTLRGTFYYDGTGPSLQNSNRSDEIVGLSVPGQAAVPRIYTLFDFNGSLGGPLVRDRIWFFTAHRYVQMGQYVANTFLAADPAAFRRVPDTSQQAYDDSKTRDSALQLTFAIGAKSKLTTFYDNQETCRCHFLVSAVQMPEASAHSIFPAQLFQATWTTAWNRVLLEAGVSPSVTGNSTPPQPGSEGYVPIIDNGIMYRNLANTSPFHNVRNRVKQTSYRAAASYVTGSHSVKVGWDMMQGTNRQDTFLSGGGLQYNLVNGNPDSITQYALLDPGPEYRLNYAMGFFAQDQWTLRRMTVSGALRVDLQKESVSAFTVGSTAWLPNRNRSFDAVEGVPSWRDVNPRFGVVYDLFGTGKTAVKASASRGVAQETVGTIQSASPIGNFSNATRSAVRAWNDANRNTVPDCNLADLTTTPGYVNGECGPLQNANFALANTAAAFGANLDQNYVNGWGERPYDWEFSAGIQHEIRPRVSASVAYFRRISGNFVVTDNQALTAADYSQYRVLVPNDPRLPGAGQATVTLRDVNVVVPARNFVTTDKNLGLSQLAHFDGIDVGVDARIRGSLLLQGGLSTGKRTTDNCEIAVALPETGPNTPLEHCHNETPFLTNVKALASYTLPWGGVRVSAAYQNIPTTPITATVNFAAAAPMSATVPSINAQLGRLFNSGATVNANVITPNSLYGDRLNQLDLKFSKLLRIQRTTFQFSMDVFNAFNDGTIVGRNLTYGSSASVSPQGVWLRPTTIIQGRFVKFGARFDF